MNRGSPPAGHATDPDHDPEATRAEISGFWRRLFAFFTDMLILATVGAVLTFAFFDRLVQLGEFGRIIGFTVALLYFGVFYSRVTNGQSPGKSLLGIKVQTREGRELSPVQSLLRCSVWGVPYFANGLHVNLSPSWPEFFRQGLSLALLVVVLGGLFSIVYLFVFNRRTRQSLHDLVLDTVVVKQNSAGRSVRETIWPGHLWINGVGVVGGLLGVVLLGFSLTGFSVYGELISIQKRVNSNPRVLRSSVNKNWSYGQDRTVVSLNVNAVVSSPDNREQFMKEIARVAMSESNTVKDVDAVNVQVSYGVDLGIFSFWYRYQNQFDPHRLEEQSSVTVWASDRSLRGRDGPGTAGIRWTIRSRYPSAGPGMINARSRSDGDVDRAFRGIFI